jgi:hypothetical protein
MKLSKTILAIVAAVASVGLLSSAQATPITGLLNIKGSATFNGPLSSATQITSFGGTEVGDGNMGSFASIAAGTPVIMTAPYIFLPLPGVANPTLWSVGGFTFALDHTTNVTQNAFAISIIGSGTILGPGSGPGSPFDNTPGTWVLTSQDPTGGHSGTTTFTFSAGSSPTFVPDGGMAISLLGLSLIGVGIFRAKFAKA